ncbi:cupin domain-containing protein [Vibrio japonicus]|uniref:Cupin domain-containing protein n=1 Tax=Vibrio japonicus TaxID=1824638 RepID=A0ABY5LQ79_9VIBR|nr:cupin domain-containing protein [Vibrio japonicus]UUM32869.1 cupin domain-containing protein [Vibrio japonicus]
MANLFQNIPNALPEEIFEDLLCSNGIKIERILSYGHTSPNDGWYDQEDNEWVLLLKGYGVIEFDDGRVVRLATGDYLNIKAHVKHKVVETCPDEVTIWLAVFY